MLFYLKILAVVIIVTVFNNAPLLGDPPPVGSGKGKIRLLYKDWEKATGYVYIPRRQMAPDCVGHAVAAALDFRLATQSLEGSYPTPQWKVDASSIYGLSRVEISNTNWGRGSKVVWGMEAVSQYGLLYKKNYSYAGYNLTKYNPKLSFTWGRDGLPSVLEEVAKITPVIEYYKVSNYREARDALVAGYSVVVGSNIGFNQRAIFRNTKATRDRDGFLHARGIWKHAMCLVGVDDKSRRKGVCCLNSKGRSWVRGPTKLAQPPGSFWIDARTVTRMAQQGASFAIVQIKSPLDYGLMK